MKPLHESESLKVIMSIIRKKNISELNWISFKFHIKNPNLSEVNLDDTPASCSKRTVGIDGKWRVIYLFL